MTGLLAAAIPAQAAPQAPAAAAQPATPVRKTLPVIGAPGVPTAEDVPLTALVPVDARITVGTLPNGLRYYIRANARPEQRAELRLVVNAGSVLEDADQRGLAHMIQLAQRPQKGALVNDLEFRVGGRGSRPGGSTPDSLVNVMAGRIGLEKRGDAFALTPASAAFLSKSSPAYLGGTLEFLNSAEVMICKV